MDRKAAPSATRQAFQVTPLIGSSPIGTAKKQFGRIVKMAQLLGSTTTQPRAARLCPKGQPQRVAIAVMLRLVEDDTAALRWRGVRCARVKKGLLNSR